jgi:DNA replication protein DnaC
MRKRLSALGLYGLLAHVEEFIQEPWLERVLQIEETERHSRSLKRRLGNTHLKTYKPMADFDYEWPTQLDRGLLQELFTLEFIEQAANVVLIAPSGVGKTMIAKNLLHQAVLRGYTALFVQVSDMLHDLSTQDSSRTLARRLRRYTTPDIICADEVGFLSYDTRYADLLFEVVSRRYQQRPIILTTNRVFDEWNQIFPNSACVVSLIDRLLHRSEILTLDGESYRLKEAKERKAKREQARSKRAPKKSS